MKYIVLILTLVILVSCNSSESENNNPVPNAADTLYCSFEFDGQTRDYIVYLPPGYKPGLPLVLNLPGYDVTPQEELDYTSMIDVADTANFVIVYPSGVNNRWNSGISDNPNWPAPDVDDVAFLSALIDTIHAQYSIDLERVYSCGWSNGGFMSFKLACELGDRIAGVASVGGAISTQVDSSCYSMPIMLFHGTADSIVTYDASNNYMRTVEETIEFWMGINNINCIPDTLSLPDINQTDGCSVDLITYRDPINEADVVFFKIIGGGHAWPGGNRDLPNERFGNTCRDINASAEIWRFFYNRTIQP
jgi:polyhydroxybutyrate depolymerase